MEQEFLFVSSSYIICNSPTLLLLVHYGEVSMPFDLALILFVTVQTYRDLFTEEKFSHIYKKTSFLLLTIHTYGG